MIGAPPQGSPAVPRPAATVVLCRGAGPIEVFLVRRHRQSGFMAGAWVFPGGRLDEADRDPFLVGRLDGLDPAALAERMDGLGDPGDAAAHAVAAIRETFEEAGLLLARTSEGASLDLAVPELAERLAGFRARMNAGEPAFADLVRDLDLVLDGGALHYLAHWVTPAVEPKRYDTRFFLAFAPPGQEGLHDGRETTDSRWLTPKGALGDHGEGRLPLAPPTWRLLGDLAGAGESVLDLVPPGRIERTEPVIALDGGALVIALPGDPLHPSTPSGAASPRRAVLRDGRWTDR